MTNLDIYWNVLSQLLYWGLPGLLIGVPFVRLWKDLWKTDRELSASAKTEKTI